MITLRVENYCQNCPDFEPIARQYTKAKQTSKSTIALSIDTEVTCKHQDRCAHILAYAEQYGKEVEQSNADSKTRTYS